MSRLKVRVPPIEELRNEVKARFGYKPCLFQVKDALAQLQGGDTITIAATGSGKTLTFWIPLLFNDEGIIIIITALNVLGEQNVKELEKLGIKAVNLTSETTSDEVFQDIANQMYRVIIVGPEKILTDSRFQRLWDNKLFVSKLFNVSIDEAHCISQWGTTFRPEYAELKNLRWKLPGSVRFHAVSATLPKLILDDVCDKLGMREATTTIIRCSNDRPNIELTVEEMKYPSSSFRDLHRVLHLDKRGTPPKFMVFLNKRRDAEKMVEEMWKELPQPLHHKVVWFHSGMSSYFKEQTIERLRKGDVWGLICTDAAGMGLDLPDIELVVQLRYVPSLCTLMQRLGRGGRGKGTIARGVYLVEPMHFDHSKNKKRRRGDSSYKETNVAQKARTSGRGGVKKNSAQVALKPSDVQRSSQRDAAVGGSCGSAQLIPEQGGALVEGSYLEGSPDGSCNTTSIMDTPTVSCDGVAETAIEGGELSGGGLGAGRRVLVEVITDCARIPFPAASKSKSTEYEESIMSMYINARGRGYCRRAICNKYFDNDKNDVLQEECTCERCVYKRTLTYESHACCDACFPEASVYPALTELPPKPRAKRKMKVPECPCPLYKEKLKTALNRWRVEELAREGFAEEEFIGPQLIMSNNILRRIIDLAYSGKITSVSILVEQTDWCEASRFGDAILKIINDIGPPKPNSPVTPTISDTVPSTTSITHAHVPLAVHASSAANDDHRNSNTSKSQKVGPNPRTGRRSATAGKENVDTAQSAALGGTKPTRRRYQCRKCGGLDHIASNKRLCPFWKTPAAPNASQTPAVLNPSQTPVIPGTSQTPAAPSTSQTPAVLNMSQTLEY